MKLQSDRLTLRGIYPRLKHALYIRCQTEHISIEKLVLKILEKELEPELKTMKILDELSSPIPVN